MLPPMYLAKSRSLRVTHLLAIPFVLLGLWLLPVKSALANDCSVSRYYVDQDATGSNNGKDWANANTSLQTALTAAVTCPNVTQIWVAEGLYKPGTLAVDTFSIRPGLALYGGFAGTESSLNQRDWESNVTVLSGDIGGNDTVDANGVVATTTNIVSQNAYHVVTMDGTGTPIVASTQIDGFVITGGEAHTGFTDEKGGGLYCDGHGAGKECSPTISNVLFSGNSSAQFGGALANLGDSGKSSPLLNNVTFSGNMSGSGGAMVNIGENNGISSPVLNDTIFRDNQAFGYGGAMLNLASHNGKSSPVLNRVTFSGNEAAGNGGAMMTLGEGGDTCSPLLTNVVFVNNSAFSGGAMYNKGNPMTFLPELRNVTFAGSSGSAMVNEIFDSLNLTYTISNSIFYGNDSQIINFSVIVPIISHSLVQGSGGSGGSWNLGMGIDGGGNIDANARYVDGAGGDLRLQSTSPAIDVGDNSAVPVTVTTDIAGAPRIFNGNVDPSVIVDMGAYEYSFFALNVARTGSGTGAVSSAPTGINCGADCTETLDFGNTTTLTATPNGDSDFAGWSGVCSGMAPCLVTVDTDNQVTANFTLKQYTVAASANPAAGGTASGGGTFTHGNSVALVATANSDYTFVNWSEGGSVVSTDPNYGFTATGNRTLVANFTLKSYTLGISASPAEGGTVSGKDVATHGESVTVTATAQSGYTFVNWTEAGSEVSTDPSYTFAVTGNRTLVANFTLNSYTLGLSASPAAAGTVSGKGAANHGESVTVTATVNFGYTFVNWTEGGSEVSSDSSYTFTVTGNRTLVANFTSGVYLPKIQRPAK